MLEHYFLLKHHSTDTIDGCRHFVAIKLAYILVSFRAEIITLILVQAKVELRSMLYDCGVER